MRALLWIKGEVLRILPAYIFFLVMFNIINMTQALMLHHKGIPPFSFVSLLIASAIVAKVLALVDHLPFIDLFPKRPLIYNILWKTVLYSIFSLIVRFLLRFGPYAIEAESLQYGFNQFLLTIDLSQFFAIQLWYILLFLGYVSSRETIIKIGPLKFRKLYFGK
ncbi:MAG: hypothetical protein P0S95_05935 [Rhabdochlamydiaceae bacterium]|nr:hypothetical protein [Candidatus Amphrikana amoebophyrae]